MKISTRYVFDQAGYQIIPGTKDSYAAINPQTIVQACKSKQEAEKWAHEKEAIKGIVNSLGRSVVSMPEDKGVNSKGQPNSDLLMLYVFNKAEVKNLLNAVNPKKAVKDHLREARKQNCQEVFIVLRLNEDLAEAINGYKRYTGVPENQSNRFDKGRCVFFIDGVVVWQSE